MLELLFPAVHLGINAGNRHSLNIAVPHDRIGLWLALRKQAKGWMCGCLREKMVLLLLLFVAAAATRTHPKVRQIEDKGV